MFNIHYHRVYSNLPSLRYTSNRKMDSLIDNLRKDIRYRLVKNGLYLGMNWKNPSLISFFAYKAPGHGYGGAEFMITMENGDTRLLTGPWSSRAGLFNTDEIQIVGCSVNNWLQHWDLNWLMKIIKAESSDIRFFKTCQFKDEVYYIPFEPGTKSYVEDKIHDYGAQIICEV